MHILSFCTVQSVTLCCGRVPNGNDIAGVYLSVLLQKKLQATAPGDDVWGPADGPTMRNIKVVEQLLTLAGESDRLDVDA